MRIFIQAQDYDMWNVIMMGPHTSTIIVDGISIFKPKKNWDEHKQAQLHAKAINILYCTLDANELIGYQHVYPPKRLEINLKSSMRVLVKSRNQK